jgi:excisionase family DNA binding protein
MKSSGNKFSQTEEASFSDNIMTAREVADYLKLTVNTVCKLAASGQLPGFKIGKSWRFDRQDVLKRIASAKRQKSELDSV